MEENVKMRIREALARYSTNPTKLSKQFSVNQKTLNSQINDMTTLSASTILLVLKAIPELSAEWLLRGTGEMIIHPSVTANTISPDDAELVALSHDLVRVISKIMDKTNTTKK
jgi:hypothetical protein